MVTKAWLGSNVSKCDRGRERDSNRYFLNIRACLAILACRVQTRTARSEAPGTFYQNTDNLFEIEFLTFVFQSFYYPARPGLWVVSCGLVVSISPNSQCGRRLGNVPRKLLRSCGLFIKRQQHVIQDTKPGYCHQSRRGEFQTINDKVLISGHVDPLGSNSMFVHFVLDPCLFSAAEWGSTTGSWSGPGESFRIKFNEVSPPHCLGA